jgi:hypothetical protein
MIRVQLLARAGISTTTPPGQDWLWGKPVFLFSGYGGVFSWE